MCLMDGDPSYKNNNAKILICHLKFNKGALH